MPQVNLRKRTIVVLAAVLAALVVAPATLWASDRFEDVPSDGTFHDEINALFDVGVTQGCATNRYCPSDDVTRAEMAGFLARLGGLGGSPPVVDAATVQGLQVYADHLVVGVENPENNEEECVPQTSSLGPDIDFQAYTVTHQLFAAPETGGQFPFDVNVSMRYTSEVPESGEYLLCFSRIDGETLQDGVYSLYRQETYNPARAAAN